MQAVRVFGNNCKLQLRNKNIDKENFADALGYSTSDVKKLLDGRLFITEEDENAIASFFSVPTKELYVENREQYKGEEFLHCMTEFDNPADEDEILNIFDMYCDLQEAVKK